MQAIIYCFSGTGNTQRVCEKYAEAFEQRGVTCTIHPMNVLTDIPDPNSFDYVGFAYPIHGFNAPYIVYKFVRALPKTDKKYFIVKTSGEPVKLNNASSLHLRKKLKKRGFAEITNEYHYVMPYNMIFRHTDLQAQKMWRTAQALVPLHVEQIVKGEKHLLKRPFMGGFIAWVLRIEHSAMKTNGRNFQVKKNCVKCMKCVNNCPVQNISYSKEKGFRFSNKCIMCARCSFHCPKDAIRIGVLNGWRVNGAYNFDGEADATQKCKKPNYCKKAYERYFAETEAEIAKGNGAL